MLSDPTRCQVALVTLPEEMPVNEVVEAAYQLEDKVGIVLGPVIVNGCYPTLDGLTVTAKAAADAAGVALDPGSLSAWTQPASSGSPARSSRRASWPGWLMSFRCPS